MKNILLEYIKIIGYTVVGLVFAYSAFYFILNFHHAKELSRTVSINVKENDMYNKIANNIAEVKGNIAGFNSGKYHGNVPLGFLLTMSGKLEICTRQFENETFMQLQDRTEFGAQDIYQFATSFQSSILNGCLIQQFYDLSSSTGNEIPDASVRSFAPFLKTNIESMIDSSSYIISSYHYNNIYYFTTDLTNNTLYNRSSQAFYKTLSLYDKSSDLLLELSNWFKNEVN